MKIHYVPLLKTARELHDVPLGRARFEQYLRTVLNDQRDDYDLVPLVIMNPMGKHHVAARLDTALGFDADDLAARAVADAARKLVAIPGEFKASLTIADDWKGGWTNRFADEFTTRFLSDPRGKRFWITGVLWSSEEPTPDLVRETILTAVYRTEYVLRHGLARTLSDMMAQEGYAMARAGCTQPCLDADDLDYTRQVLQPFLDESDKRTCIEYLFGDATADSLGFTRRGLSPWAGLALALHEARFPPNR